VLTALRIYARTNALWYVTNRNVVAIIPTEECVSLGAQKSDGVTQADEVVYAISLVVGSVSRCDLCT
jgi:hypothetical protein